MAQIRIDSMFPATGKVPKTEIGGTSLYAWSLWELDDEAQWSFQVPEGFQSPDDIVVHLSEATAGQSLKHKWQLTVGLYRSGSSVVTAATWQEVFTQEFSSPAIADQETIREIPITTDGEIDGVAVLPEDNITVTLERIAASAFEDPNEIKVTTIEIFMEVVAEEVSARCGWIINRFREIYNETGGEGFSLNAELLEWMNVLQRELSAEGYFEKIGYISLVADQQEYDFQTLFSDYSKPLAGVYWDETGAPLKPIHNLHDWLLIDQGSPTGSRPDYYRITGSKIWFSPTPDTADTNAIKIPYAWLPDDMESASTDYPATPESFDMMYVWFLQFMVYVKDTHNKVSQRRAQDAEVRYLRMKNELLDRPLPDMRA